MKSKAAQTSMHPRDEILDKSMRLFSQYGYTGTTMRDIARAVGILPGSVYAHIDSKETLLIEIVEKGIDEFLAAVDRKPDVNQSFEARMRAAIKAHVAVVAESPERTLVVFHQWRYLTEPNLSRVREKRRKYEQSFARMIGDGIKGGVFDQRLDVKIAVFTVLGALNWTPEWYSPGGRSGADEIGEKLADAILWGLVCRKS